MKKLKKENIVDQICEEIKKDINDGKWQVGDKLQSENELAEILGVSRVSVRAALQKLQAIGYIETRFGEGSFVKKFSLQTVLTAVSPDILNTSTIDDLREFRKSMELGCVKLAIERGTEKDIEKLDESLDKLVLAAKNGDSNTFLDADYQFHIQIASMSKNSIYILMYDTISELVKLYNQEMRQKAEEKYINTPEQVWAFAIESHSNIVKAIKNRDYESCLKIYEKMIDIGY